MVLYLTQGLIPKKKYLWVPKLVLNKKQEYKDQLLYPPLFIEGQESHKFLE